MSRLEASQKSTTLALLFAWPAAVAIGWLVGRLTDTDWPIPVMAVAWMACLFVFLRRADDQRN